jgi:vacuolar-type H+-ATPase subunit H
VTGSLNSESPLSVIRDAERDCKKKLAAARREAAARIDEARAEALRVIEQAAERAAAADAERSRAAEAAAEREAARILEEASVRAAKLAGALPGADAAVAAMLALVAGIEEAG